MAKNSTVAGAGTSTRDAGRLGGLAYARRLDGLRQRAAAGDAEAQAELEKVRARARENGRKRRRK